MSNLPKLKIKNFVTINGAHFYPEIVKIVNTVRATAPPLKDNTVWITSGADGQHMHNSLHYANKALDFRIWNLVDASTINDWKERISLILGSDYDVIIETNHLHVEYDVK